MNELDKHINETFSSHYMNNTKWLKLFDTLSENLDEFYLEYKLIYSAEIESTTFFVSDMPPFFIEPILYKEVEWIRFPLQYEQTINRRTTRSYTKEFSQDIGEIERIIKSIGEFELELGDSEIKLFGYKK